MNKTLAAIFSCATSRKESPSSFSKPSPFQYNEKTVSLTCDETADQIVNVLFGANKDGSALTAHIDSIVHQAGGWSEWLAERIRNGVEEALKNGKEMNSVLAAAYDRACEAATVFERFSKDHPIATEVFVTVLAIGVLAILAPYVLEWLGFAELGIIEGELATMFYLTAVGGNGRTDYNIGSWAARWQSTFGGFVPKGSLFSYLQKLGMIWNMGGVKK